MLTPRDLLIIGFVSRRPSYGHEIKKRVASTYAEEWVRISQPHIYYVLEKLRKARYLTSKEEKVGNTPLRTVYAITEKGRSILNEMLQDDKLLKENYYLNFYVVLAMLGFTKSLSPEESVAIIEKRKMIVGKFITDLSASSKTHYISGMYGPIAETIYKHRLKSIKNEYKWLEEILSYIKANGWEAFARGPVKRRRTSSKKEKVALSV